MKLENSHFGLVLRLVVFALSSVLMVIPAGAQNIDSLADRSLAASVLLDSIVITAQDTGLEVADFVDAILKDESLYTAFRNLRKTSVSFITDMAFEDKRGNEAGGLNGTYRQEYNDGCREMVSREEKYFGDYHKGRKKKERYYTAKLYQRVFVTEGVVCDDNGEQNVTTAKDDDKMESRIDELKQLIFNPGTKARVPLIAGKTELFDPDLMRYYDFTISDDQIKGLEAFKFEARAKDDVADGKTVFKTLVTWFSKTDFQVLSRTYTLSANTAAYSFDVTMAVDLVIYQNKYYPETVSYAGSWNIPFKKRETGHFTIKFSNFNPPKS